MIRRLSQTGGINEEIKNEILTRYGKRGVSIQFNESEIVFYSFEKTSLDQVLNTANCFISSRIKKSFSLMRQI